MDTFTPEFIAEQREKAKKLESPAIPSETQLYVEDYGGKSYLRAGKVMIADFTIASGNIAEYLAEYLAEAGNNYPAALDEIERLRESLKSLLLLIEEHGGPVIKGHAKEIMRAREELEKNTG